MIQHHGSLGGCTKLVGCNKNHKRLLCRGSPEKFLHCGSVEGCIELVGYIEYHKSFLRLGSVEGCTKLVGFIEYHKRFLSHGWVEYFLHHESVEMDLTPWKRGGLY